MSPIFLLSDDASLEEGEISEEEEEQCEEAIKEFNEAYDGVNEVYDRARYYGRRSKEVRPSSSELVLDSPASPDMAEQTAEVRRDIPTIPMEKEPRLPPELEERGGWVQVSGPQEQPQEEEEDLDEDLLYLRLIALRSLATEKEEEEKREKEAEGKTEMLELLEEAKLGDVPGEFYILVLWNRCLYQ